MVQIRSEGPDASRAAYSHSDRQGLAARGRPRLGFTLVEVLVVVAIVAILASILFPVFAAAKESAKRSVCASNMRQIGIALAMYTDDYDGRMPGTAHTSPFHIEGSWIFQLRPYVGNLDEIRICPADPRGRQRLANDGTSYILNEYLVVDGPGAVLNLHALARPTETVTTFTISDQAGVTWQQDHTHSRGWFTGRPDRNWVRIRRDVQVDRFHPSLSGGVVGGSANYLYADTSVRAIPAMRIRTYAETNFNFAIPPSN
ncbi:MAG: DUF1559 domain-containing protein [Fimbriimonadaceae bacterium]